VRIAVNKFFVAMVLFVDLLPGINQPFPDGCAALACIQSELQDLI
jgi:hypothetical protein